MRTMLTANKTPRNESNQNPMWQKVWAKYPVIFSGEILVAIELSLKCVKTSLEGVDLVSVEHPEESTESYLSNKRH